MTLLAHPPKSLVPNADGHVQLDRPSCYCQILLALHEETPTKLETLHRRLPFAVQTVRDSLYTLCAFGFIEKVDTAKYVRRYVPLGVDQ